MKTTVLKNTHVFVVLKFDELVDTNWVWVGTYSTQEEAFQQEQSLRVAGAQATVVPKNITKFEGTIQQKRHVNATDWSKYDARVQGRG